MIFDLESSGSGQAPDEAGRQSRAGAWLQLIVILSLITVSVLFVMICACDTPWQTPLALVLLAFSLAACLAAAYVLFRVRRFAGNSGPIVRAVASIGVVIAVRYLELKLAIDCVAWLAGSFH
jgi:hypothetical protein